MPSHLMQMWFLPLKEGCDSVCMYRRSHMQDGYLEERWLVTCKVAGESHFIPQRSFLWPLTCLRQSWLACFTDNLGGHSNRGINCDLSD